MTLVHLFCDRHNGPPFSCCDKKKEREREATNQFFEIPKRTRNPP